MDGFVQANDGWESAKLPTGADPQLASGQRAMYWHDEHDLPFYYDLGRTFAIADHYHASLLGPTWPNRMYLLAGTSFGIASNSFPDISAYPYPGSAASILDELEQAKITWNLYTDGLPGAGVVYSSAFVKRWDRTVKYSGADFLGQAAAGTLPSVSFLDPHIGSEGPSQNDEHPPADVQVGQKFVSDVVHALFASPQWPHMALFITWDEHGGYYDHVPPPAACPPDALPPVPPAGDTTPGGFDRYGVRVPLLVVSPYAKAGHTGHATYDHTSITRFLETRFELAALSGRDANADPLTDMFDFDKPAFATPPMLADAVIDPAELAYCKATYGGKLSASAAAPESVSVSAAESVSESAAAAESVSRVALGGCGGGGKVGGWRPHETTGGFSVLASGLLVPRVRRPHHAGRPRHRYWWLIERRGRSDRCGWERGGRGRWLDREGRRRHGCLRLRRPLRQGGRRGLPGGQARRLPHVVHAGSVGRESQRLLGGARRLRRVSGSRHAPLRWAQQAGEPPAGHLRR